MRKRDCGEPSLLQILEPRQGYNAAFRSIAPCVSYVADFGTLWRGRARGWPEGGANRGPVSGAADDAGGGCRRKPERRAIVAEGAGISGGKSRRRDRGRRPNRSKLVPRGATSVGWTHVTLRPIRSARSPTGQLWPAGGAGRRRRRRRCSSAGSGIPTPGWRNGVTPGGSDTDARRAQGDSRHEGHRCRGARRRSSASAPSVPEIGAGADRRRLKGLLTKAKPRVTSPLRGSASGQ
jgi:hypothetical protein